MRVNRTIGWAMYVIGSIALITFGVMISRGTREDTIHWAAVMGAVLFAAPASLLLLFHPRKEK